MQSFELLQHLNGYVCLCKLSAAKVLIHEICILCYNVCLSSLAYIIYVPVPTYNSKVIDKSCVLSNLLFKPDDEKHQRWDGDHIDNRTRDSKYF